MVKLKSQRQLTIGHLDLKETDCFVQRFLAQLRITNACVENIKG